jgi:glycosyltransferase involved in cell wall biosynthesis
MKKLSVIIPVYNERPFIRESVEKVIQAVSKTRLNFSVLIIDDGSTDGTRDELVLLQKEYSSIRLFLQPFNQGKGAALQKGIMEADGDIVLFQDADLEYSPDDIETLLQPLLSGQADVVYGSRFSSRPSRRILNFHHQIINQTLTLASNLATGLNLTDMETGYKAFRADVIKTIPLRSQRFGIEPEITAKIAKRNCIIYEVPVSYNGRGYGEGKKITWRDGIKAFYTIFKFWLIDDCYNKKQIAETFNDLERTHHACKYLVERILPYLGDRFIEIGSGIGTVSRFLPVREKMTISEWRPDFLNLLNSGFAEKSRIEVETLDINSKEMPARLDNRFDTAIFLHQLQFCPDQDQVLQNLHALLQKNGRLLLAVPDGKTMGPYEEKLGYLRRYSADELQNLLTRHGFVVLQQFTFNFPAKIIWNGVVRKRRLEQLPLFWAKISDILVRRFSFLESLFGLEGLTRVVVAEKVSDQVSIQSP